MSTPERLLPPGSAPELPRMSLIEHLEELRKRIFWSLLGVAVAFFPCWNYSKWIFDHFLTAPILPYLPNHQLVYNKLADPFLLYFKLACILAIFASSPFILYQAWRFISPGLYAREKRYALPFVFFTSLFFLGGGAFGYYVAFPRAAAFFFDIGKGLTPLITVDTYLSFLTAVLLGMGLMFELPVLIFLLSWLGVVTPRFLMRQFRWAVVIIFVIAAVVTPTPDIVNQCIFAIPGVALYLLGVGAAYLVHRDKNKKKLRPA